MKFGQTRVNAISALYKSKNLMFVYADKPHGLISPQTFILGIHLLFPQKKKEHICWEITFPCRLFPSLSFSEPSWLGQGWAQPPSPSCFRAGGGLTGAQTHSQAPWVPARPQRDFPRAGQHVPKLPAAGFDASVHQFLPVLISLWSTPSFLPCAPKVLQHLDFPYTAPPAPVLWGFSAKRSLDLQK